MAFLTLLVSFALNFAWPIGILTPCSLTELLVPPNILVDGSAR